MKIIQIAVVQRKGAEWLYALDENGVIYRAQYDADGYWIGWRRVPAIPEDVQDLA